MLITRTPAVRTAVIVGTLTGVLLGIFLVGAPGTSGFGYRLDLDVYRLGAYGGHLGEDRFGLAAGVGRAVVRAGGDDEHDVAHAGGDRAFGAARVNGDRAVPGVGMVGKGADEFLDAGRLRDPGEVDERGDLEVTQA